MAQEPSVDPVHAVNPISAGSGAKHPIEVMSPTSNDDPGVDAGFPVSGQGAPSARPLAGMRAPPHRQ